jgi:hypothetical protein
MVEVGLIVSSDPVVHHLEILCMGRLDIKACDDSNAVVKGPQYWVNGVLQPGTKTQIGTSVI